MTAFLACVFFVLGAVAASFAGVLAGRLHTGQSVIAGRSRCDACGRELTALNLIPLLSWVLARGRARCCGARVSPLGPLSELVLGALFALAYLRLGISPGLALLCLALTLLLALVLYDLAHQILPPLLLGAFFIFAVLFGYLESGSLGAFGHSALYALAFAVFFFALYACTSGRALGFSDIPLVFALSLMAGDFALAGFLLSFWIGAGVGIGLLACVPRGARINHEVPFAPFLAAGFLLAYFTQWDPIAAIASILAWLGVSPL